MRVKKGKTGGRATEKGIGHSSRIQEEKHTKKWKVEYYRKNTRGRNMASQ